MPYQLNVVPSIPRETERSAKAIFGRGNFYILAGEHLESTLQDIQMESLLASGATLPQITFFQSLEGLTDAQAIEAVRTRLDWKYALHLRVYPPMLPGSALCEFRQRILNDPQCQHEFQRIIDRLVTLNPPCNNRFQSFINLELVSYVCSINRLDWVQATMGRMLEILAVRFPDWLRKITLPHWYGRYNHASPNLEEGYWPDQPEYSMEEIAADIDHLLEEIHRASPLGISGIKEVRALEHVWKQQVKSLLTDKRETLKPEDCDSCVYRTGLKEA